MSISCDGPCRSSNDCAAGQPEHGSGWTPFDGASPPCSRTGTCCHPPHAGLWEPYDGRPSRTVLREREGEAPSRSRHELSALRAGELRRGRRPRPRRWPGVLHVLFEIPRCRAMCRVLRSPDTGSTPSGPNARRC